MRAWIPWIVAALLLGGCQCGGSQPVCGDGVLDEGEVCDPAIATGAPGSCPTSCDDQDACTTDTMLVVTACGSECSHVAIAAGPSDVCCPAGATLADDPDCPVACGDAVVSASETCDTAISAGPGTCPASCDDQDACTVDALANGGTCTALCSWSPAVAGTADQCCPAGSNLSTDPDCPAACGDGVTSAPETCDDGNTAGYDGCSAACRTEPIAFRATDLDLRDPHLFATIIGCNDITDLSGAGINPTIQTRIQGDGDGDGFLDLSLAQTFLPLAQAAGNTSDSALVFPDCTAPMSSTTCALPVGGGRNAGTATSEGGSTICLEPIGGTINTGYTPAIVSPTAGAGGNCYWASIGTVTLNLGGLPVTLVDTMIAGEWFGDPATEVRNGLLRGFLTEATADATIIPAGTTGIASIDGQPLSSLLRGGVNNCSQPSPQTGDKDSYTPPGGAPVSGWYMYLNFTGAKVPYTEL